MDHRLEPLEGGAVQRSRFRVPPGGGASRRDLGAHETYHGVAARAEKRHEGRPDEARGPGDENPHEVATPPSFLPDGCSASSAGSGPPRPPAMKRSRRLSFSGLPGSGGRASPSGDGSAPRASPAGSSGRTRG